MSECPLIYVYMQIRQNLPDLWVTPLSCQFVYMLKYVNAAIHFRVFTWKVTLNAKHNDDDYYNKVVIHLACITGSLLAPGANPGKLRTAVSISVLHRAHALAHMGKTRQLHTYGNRLDFSLHPGFVRLHCAVFFCQKVAVQI